MENNSWIAVDEICAKHEIDISFVLSLKKIGLIEVTTLENELYLDVLQLPELEKYVCFYYELDINLEGIETISHLLNKVTELQHEITALRNKLYLYD